LAEALGVWKEKNMYGKKTMGIERSTFVINPDNQIIKEWRKVKVAGHAQEVFDHIKEFMKTEQALLPAIQVLLLASAELVDFYT